MIKNPREQFMDILSDFGDNIKELIDDKKITVEDFAKSVDIAFSEVYRYLRKIYLPKLSNLIKIADCYNYSIDFLLGFIPFPEETVFNKTPPFDKRFKQILSDNKLTRYKISKETGISLNRLDDWYNGKFTPSLDKAIILSKYLKMTIDELLGRET